MKSLERLISVLTLAGTLGLLVAGLWTTVSFSTIDALWLPDGTVEWVLPASPAAEQLAVGDRVLQVDDQPVALTGRVFSAKRPGDSVIVTVARSGQSRTVTLPVKSKSIEQLLIQSSGSGVLAVAFWLIGAALIIQALMMVNPAGSGTLAGAFFALTGAELILGGLSQFVPDWILRLYGMGLWLIGPLGLWLHLAFPRPYSLARSRWFVPGLLAFGVGGALWGWLATPDYLGALNGRALAVAYLWLTGNVLASVGLIVWSWWRHPSPGERRQLGVVALGATLSLVPLVVIIIVPRLLGFVIADDQGFAMLPLVLLPASYGYAIYRYRRLAQDQEQWLMRGLRYLFSAMAVSLVIMLVLSMPIVKALPSDAQIWAAIFGGGLATPIVMGLARALWDLALFGHVRQPLRQAAAATDRIDLGIDAEDLSEQVGQILRNLVGITDSAILVLNHERQLVDASASGRARAAEGLAIPEGSDVAELFSGQVPILEFDEQRDRLLASPGRVLLGVPWAQAAIPLRTQRDLIGVLLIGYQDGKPFLDEEDILVLGMVSRSVATTLQRRSLVRDLRERNEEASLLSQELLRVREDERKRIARDLHDEVIQNLIAVSYGLATLEHQPGPALRDQVMHVIERARTLCFDLRQFQLDNLGLGGAVRHVADAFAERTALRTLAHVAEEPGVVVPETLSTALLGILEETLNNVGQHAQASLVEIWISVTAESVCLRVFDNGVGFDRRHPARGDCETHHFGLAMMEERAALVSGQLEVRSSPGNGTEVVFAAALEKAAAARAA